MSIYIEAVKLNAMKVYLVSTIEKRIHSKIILFVKLYSFFSETFYYLHCRSERNREWKILRTTPFMHKMSCSHADDLFFVVNCVHFLPSQAVSLSSFFYRLSFDTLWIIHPERSINIIHAYWDFNIIGKYNLPCKLWCVLLNVHHFLQMYWQCLLHM